MKKNLLFISLFLFSFFYSQCIISGSDQIEVGERQIYKATETEILCSNCYQWTYLDQKVLLENDDNQNEITLKGSVPGESILSLEINGKTKCQKSISVIAPTKNLTVGDSGKCDIALEVFKETRLEGDKVLFEPEIGEGKFTFLWTVHYRNGFKKTATDKAAQFDYSVQNVIDYVELQVKMGVCIKKISKSYDTNFWYFF